MNGEKLITKTRATRGASLDVFCEFFKKTWDNLEVKGVKKSFENVEYLMTRMVVRRIYSMKVKKSTFQNRNEIITMTDSAMNLVMYSKNLSKQTVMMAMN